MMNLKFWWKDPKCKLDLEDDKRKGEGFAYIYFDNKKENFYGFKQMYM